MGLVFDTCVLEFHLPNTHFLYFSLHFQASSPESPTMYCHSPGETDTKIYLWNGTEVASFSVVKILDYKSRIRLSGTIRNLTIRLTDLSLSDRDGYTCRGTAKGIGDFMGNETSLSVGKKYIYGHIYFWHDYNRLVHTWGFCIGIPPLDLGPSGRCSGDAHYNHFQLSWVSHRYGICKARTLVEAGPI